VLVILTSLAEGSKMMSGDDSLMSMVKSGVARAMQSVTARKFFESIDRTVE